jgi:hypothetical protein
MPYPAHAASCAAEYVRATQAHPAHRSGGAFRVSFIGCASLERRVLEGGTFKDDQSHFRAWARMVNRVEEEWCPRHLPLSRLAWSDAAANHYFTGYVFGPNLEDRDAEPFSGEDFFDVKAENSNIRAMLSLRLGQLFMYTKLDGNVTYFQWPEFHLLPAWTAAGRAMLAGIYNWPAARQQQEERQQQDEKSEAMLRALEI